MPDGWGGMPDQWRQVFDNSNLIWIGASPTSRNPSVIKQVCKRSWPLEPSREATR
jgi:hypothetical protein